MKRLLICLGLLVASARLFSQELYVATEPASNMPTGGVAARVTQMGNFNDMGHIRLLPELMLGISKSLMVHGSLYLSNFKGSSSGIEGWSTYAKYRFLSIDSTNRHFRGAIFAKYASSRNAVTYQDIDLEGSNSGWQSGVVFTQLLHKLALSSSLNYTKALDNHDGNLLPDGFADESIGYTFSTGLLIYPKTYRDYKQTNVNVYLEFLGKKNVGVNENFMDAAPALQFIINSKVRIDLSQRFQLWGNMSRYSKNTYLIRLEYNWFNALKF